MNNVQFKIMYCINPLLEWSYLSVWLLISCCLFDIWKPFISALMPQDCSLEDVLPISDRQWYSGRAIPEISIGLIVFLCFLSKPSLAQAQDQQSEQVEREIEYAVELQSDEEGEPELLNFLEDLERLRYQPLDLNHASADELNMVPGITTRLANNIIRFRDENGEYGSVEELLNVPGIGPATLERVQPFLTTSEDHSSYLRRWLQPDFWATNGRLESYSRFRQVLQPQEGYQRPDTLGGYVGSPVNLYQRIRYQSRHLSVNTTLNKSPGEPYQPPFNFAYTSWHIAVRDVGMIETMIIGDYSASFGQGLLLWTGGAFGKSSNVISGAVKNERGIRPSSTTQPASGFRGFAINSSITKNLRITGFYSDKKRTSTVVDDQYVNFPSSTGRYRTLNELKRKNNLSQETVGGRLLLVISSGQLGFTAVRNSFDKEIVQGNQLYQRYNFSGQQLYGFSSDIRYDFRNIHLFGELAVSNNRGMALMSGADIQLSEKTTFLVLIREYEKNFHSIFGSGFGEQSGSPRNERGIYLGIQHHLTSKLELNIYMDQFHFPAPRFQTRQPTSGYDWLVHLDYVHSRDLQLYLLTRFKQREIELAGFDTYGREVRWIKHHLRFNSRLHLEYRVHPKARLRFRTDFVVAAPPGSDLSNGFLLYTDLRVNPHKRIRLDFRITMFDTDDYESRVFQFENDLLYVMTNRMLYDRGQRVYLNLHYQASERLDFWFKISTTIYENRNVIGSGMELIHGNRRSEIGIQARIRV